MTCVTNTFPGDYPTQMWTITLGFTAANEDSARAVGYDVARRLAEVLPGYDKNDVVLARDSDPGVMVPLFCADDIYCHRPPGHDGPCQDRDGHDLDNTADTDTDTANGDGGGGGDSTLQDGENR